MKALKRLIFFLLFLTCHFLLPQSRETVQYGGPLSHTPDAFTSAPSSSLSAGIHTPETIVKIKYGKEVFKRRPVGLNDTHEEALAVYSFDVYLLFVYIHTRYRTYGKTLHDVAINLSDWRGPPSVNV